MTLITRNHSKAEATPFDLIVIGGGVYGIALALAASQRGISCLLLEKKDFGWATSYNSLRTIHGGLRYLQKMDLPRFFESVGERRWFMRQFPGLVTPLPCLMPLYGNGVYRPSVFRVALGLNDLLSLHRNHAVAPGQEILNGRVVNTDEVIRIFPQVDTRGLKGGAVWYDGGMPSSQLVVTEMLKQACRDKRVSVLNYTEATDLECEGGIVRGIRAVDCETGQRFRFMANKVVNAAGPWCRNLAERFDHDDPSLFRYSIAWNVLFAKPALSRHSLAVKPDIPGARMYFLHNWHGLIMGGTVHDPWPVVTDCPMPDNNAIQRYIDHLNTAIPRLRLIKKDILQIYSGLLPVKEQGGNILTVREVIKNHEQDNGPKGLYSITGIKFTTARKVAIKTLNTIFSDHSRQKRNNQVRPPLQVRDQPQTMFTWDWLPEESSKGWQDNLETIIRDQSVLHLDDLLLRRTTLGDNPVRALKAAPAIARLFKWDKARCAEEVQNLTRYYKDRMLRLPDKQ